MKKKSIYRLQKFNTLLSVRGSGALAYLEGQWQENVLTVDGHACMIRPTIP